MENSYILRGEIPPPRCWVESIDHTGETEHQTGEAGLKAGKYQLPRNDTASKG